MKLTLLFFLLINQISFAQSIVDRDSVISNLKHLRKTINCFNTESEKMSSEVSNNNALISQFIKIINRSDATYPDLYNKSIGLLVKLAGETKDGNIAEQLEFLSLVSKDLESKLFISDSSAQLNSIPLCLSVEVTVRVKSLQGDVNNLRVNCTPLGYSVNFYEPFFSFSRLTSPAVDQIPPGYYLFWITDDGSFKPKRSIKKEIKPNVKNIIEFSI